MASGHPSRRLQRAKSEVSHSRSSVASIKDDFRNRFFTRLRTTRSKSVDRFRQIVENYGDNLKYKSLNDLRKALLSDKEATELLNTDEVDKILKQIEVEMEQVSLEYEGEKYVNESDNETEDIVRRLMNTCGNCDTLVVSGNICSNCSILMSSEFN